MNASDLRARLTNALTAHDERQSAKRGYNPYALAQYLARIDDVIAHVEAGKPIDAALDAAFNDRVLAIARKAIAR